MFLQRKCIRRKCLRRKYPNPKNHRAILKGVRLFPVKACYTYTRRMYECPLRRKPRNSWHVIYEPKSYLFNNLKKKTRVWCFDLSVGHLDEPIAWKTVSVRYGSAAVTTAYGTIINYYSNHNDGAGGLGRARLHFLSSGVQEVYASLIMAAQLKNPLKPLGTVLPWCFRGPWLIPMKPKPVNCMPGRYRYYKWGNY